MSKETKKNSEEVVETPLETTEKMNLEQENEAEAPYNEENEQPINDPIMTELAETKAKLAELNDTYLRLMAEFENFRRRTLKEKSDLLKYGAEGALKNLLPVIDNFERAKGSIEKATDVAALAEGVELIYQQFISYLKDNGVSAIDTQNAPFDTEYHEAITTIPAPSEEMKGKVVDCVQKGYILNDKVIRFSKVVVGE